MTRFWLTILVIVLAILIAACWLIGAIVRAFEGQENFQ